MKLKLAEARSSEYHSAWGEAGSQDHKADYSDGELRIREISDDFDLILRWKDAELARKAARLAIGLVKNWFIGYSQNNGESPRTTMTDELEAAGGDPSKISKPCNTDCSAMIAAICRSCGLDVSRDIYTGNQIAALTATGAFELIHRQPGEIYTVGDILWRTGHTAIVVDMDDEEPDAKYMTVTGAKSVNMRDYYGKDKAEVIQELFEGDRIKLTGRTAIWYEGTYKGVTGWVSGKYLK